MSEPSISFALTEADKHSSLWVRLVEHFNTKLFELRGQNDGDLTESQTAIIRGQIKNLKGLLALGEIPPSDGERNRQR